ncbi:MAG: SpoIIE family protein phosphatase [Phycisphaeraceae bacterium]|nr:SpoIIE family protein phosphatase [Phycisphaeraceae bacterium]
MSIRWKLLALLLVMTLGPLLVSRAMDIWAIGNLGREVGTEVRVSLTLDARLDLMRLIESYATIIERESTIGMLLLRNQAREVEFLLDQRQPDGDERTLFFSRDFEGNGATIPGMIRSEHHGRLLPDGEIEPRWVSFQHPVFHHAPGVEMEAVHDDLIRLSGVGRKFAQLSETLTAVLWQYVSLDNGAHVSWPGKGEYPEDFDPRDRSWYRSAMEQGRPGWQPPIGDVTTGRAVLTASMPVFRHVERDGQIERIPAGVTGLDVPLASVLGTARLNTPWAHEAELLLIRLAGQEEAHQFTETPPDAQTVPIIFAQSSFREEQQDWRRPPSFRVLGLPEGSGFEPILADMVNGRLDVRTVELKERTYLCGYGPIEVEGQAAGYLVIMVPEPAITQQATELEQQIHDQFWTLLHQTGMVALLVAALGVILAWRGASRVTRPVRELAQAAGRIAEGDLDHPPAEPRGRDELDQMVRAFARMVPALRDHMRIRESLRLATEVQQSLLPEGPPTIEGLELAGDSRYCDETGGDYFDYLRFQRLGPRHLAVAIGDVTGHGVAAALLMATARGILRSRVNQSGSLAEAFGDINRHLVEDQCHGRFMTLFYLVIDLDDRKLRWLSCGHDPAWLIDVESGRSTMLEGADVPLGVAPDWSFNESERPMPDRESLIVVGTDGIWETADAQGRFYGKDRLVEVVLRHRLEPTRAIIDAVLADLAAFRGERRQRDDVTLVIVRILPDALQTAGT